MTLQTSINSSDSISSKECPCRTCKPPKRHIEPTPCHDTCEEYQQWKVKLDELNEMIRLKKEEQYIGLKKKRR